MTDLLSIVADREAADKEWNRVCAWAREKFGRDPSVESLLFLIGIDSRGGDFAVRLKKEMKQDLIMEGTYAALATLGVYRRRAQEEAGAERWARVETVPVLSQPDQERLLQIAIARYLSESIFQGK